MLTEISHSSLDPMAKPTREGYFGKLLSELAKTCSSFNLTLEDVARGDLEKIASRWPSDQKRDFPLFDEHFLGHERFEREFKIEFIERGEGQKRHVVQRLNGAYIGDRLRKLASLRLRSAESWDCPPARSGAYSMPLSDSGVLLWEHSPFAPGIHCNP